MKISRRAFSKDCALVATGCALGGPIPALASARQLSIHVSPDGRDDNPGTESRPLASIGAAQLLARKHKASGPVTVWLRGGKYYLPETLVLTAADSGTEKAPVTYAAVAGEEAVLSGAVKLSLTWTPYSDGIMMAQVPAGLRTDQLFVNGQQQILARYPNYDPSATILGGWSPDAISPERAARWSDPRGGFIHAMHKFMWASADYLITGKDAQGNVTYVGGWQNNRVEEMHPQFRYVENIFEELDSPGEWFLNEKTDTLYFYPPAGLDLHSAVVEVVRLRGLVEFRGGDAEPVRWINMRGLTLRHAARTFMDSKEPMLRGDWTVYRGGAILLSHAEDCALEELSIDHVGGNAIFVSNYNRRIAIRRTHIADAGASGVAFVGDPKAVRSALLEYHYKNSLKDLDLAPGPIGSNYPAQCILEDSLIERTGRVEKQTAPVDIDMAQNITVRHVSAYDVPRAGINIGDGCWGGHIIEHNDIFDTVRETADHGSFNSWGRDRYWELKDVDPNTIASGPNHELPRLDSVTPTILRYNRFRCNNGWDIDLDDGSTNFHIYSNLTLKGGIKLREGFFRTVENNVIVSNSLHCHAWFRGSEDVFRHNIVFKTYQTYNMDFHPWGAEIDNNLRHVAGMAGEKPDVDQQKLSGRDEHSLEADALFMNPVTGDYRVKDGSPALRLGFQNFPMDQFGVQWPKLKQIARTPELPRPGEVLDEKDKSGRDPQPITWMGAKFKNVIGMGEVSGNGLPGEVGILALDVPEFSQAAAYGLKKFDVILELDGKRTDAIKDLKRLTDEVPAWENCRLTVWRKQEKATVVLPAPWR